VLPVGSCQPDENIKSIKKQEQAIQPIRDFRIFAAVEYSKSLLS
jgi:hypothetical protein